MKCSLLNQEESQYLKTYIDRAPNTIIEDLSFYADDFWDIGTRWMDY